MFYGTEILTEGGYDPDCRRCMDWEKTTMDGEYSDVFELLRLLSDIRKDKAYAEGMIRISEKSNVFILTNIGIKDEIKLYINNTMEMQVVDSVSLQPHSFMILRNGGVIAHE